MCFVLGGFVEKQFTLILCSLLNDFCSIRSFTLQLAFAVGIFVVAAFFAFFNDEEISCYNIPKSFIS